MNKSDILDKGAGTCDEAHINTLTTRPRYPAKCQSPLLDLQYQN